MSPIDEVAINSDNAGFSECLSIILSFYCIGMTLFGDLYWAFIFLLGALICGLQCVRLRKRVKAGRQALVDILKDK